MTLSKYLHNETLFQGLSRRRRVQRITHKKLFIEPQGEFCDLSCLSPLCMSEKIHLFLMLNIGNVILTKIGLGHENYTVTNIHHFFLNPLNSDFYLTVEFEVFTALFMNIRVLWDMTKQHGNVHKRLQSFL